jgi:general secretion pathway protein O
MMDKFGFEYIVFYIFIGLCVGSFLNVIIYRLPIMLAGSESKNTINNREEKSNILKDKFNLFFPNSFCPCCHNPLLARDNIPVFSWLFLRGITRCCNKRISPRYLVVELLTVILTLMVVFFAKNDYLMVASIFLYGHL